SSTPSPTPRPTRRGSSTAWSGSAPSSRRGPPISRFGAPRSGIGWGGSPRPGRPSSPRVRPASACPPPPGRPPRAGRARGGPEGWRLGPRGVDQAEFLFAANPGEDPKPLAKIASGGELSRSMLALKVILAATEAVPILVFDEVDVGIGGRTADVVGRKLRQV